MSFDVLFVCTGNICRSPAAERLLAATVRPEWGITSASAGTGALVGHGIDAPTALALGELGVDASGHRARRLEPDMVTAAALVLTATVEHRSAVVRATPLAFRRVFTINEFARLGYGSRALSSITDDALRDRVAEIAGRRGLVDAPAEGVDDIGDPFGADIEVARSTVHLIRHCTNGVRRALGLPG